MPNSSQLAVKTQWTLSLFNNLIKDLFHPLAVAGTAKTLASHAITVAPANGEGFYTVDTQGSAAWDTLYTITGGNDGDIIYLLQANASRSVLLTTAGNLGLPAGGALCLSATIPLGFRYNGTLSKWQSLNIFDPSLVQVYNNDASTLNQADIVVIDPTASSAGLVAVKTTTAAGDYRAIGVVVSPTIPSAGNGFIAIANKQLINVTGAVAFGHSLAASTTAHYAADTGGGGKAPGVIGWALGTQASGNGQIWAMISPNPQYWTAAQTLTQKYGNNDVSTSGSQAAATNVVNTAPNQLLLFACFNAATLSSPTWNSQTPTQVQAASASLAYLGYLLGAAAASASFMVSLSSNTAAGVALALNGINQGGGANTFGTWANQNGAGSSVSLTVTCNPGDLVVCIVTVRGTGVTFSGRNQTSVETAVGTNTAYDVQSAVATGTSVTFALTIGGTITHFSADGVALHSA
jgi:hypothetical protein